MNRYLLSIATLSTIALLPLSPPSFAARVEAMAFTGVSRIGELGAALSGPEAPSLVAETTRFGAIGVPASALDAVPGARAAFATVPAIAGAVPVRAPSVLVVGGTPAGVAAALAAARHGADVTLVSESERLGGVLTDAMMDQWDLNRAPDGAAIEGGIFPRMYARLGDAFSPADAARTFATMISAEPRIRVVFGAVPTAVATTATAQGSRVDGVTVEDAQTGRARTLAGDAVIDATDDADVVALAGGRYDVGRQDTGIDERMQSVTLMFAMTGVDWKTVTSTYDSAAFGPGGATPRRAWGYAKFSRGYTPLDANTVVRDLNFGHLADGSVTVNAIDLCNVNALSATERDHAYFLAMGESYALLGYLRAHLPGFAHAHIDRFAQRLYVRETRHVAGLERITTSDIWQGRVPGDTIGLSSYPIDLHAVLPTQLPAFASTRHIYGIPFGALTPRGLTNVVMASPAISATHVAAGSARVVPTTIEEGEAAGVAAAIAASDDIDVLSIAKDPARVATLRGSLAQDGTILAVPRPIEAVAAGTTIATPRTWDYLVSPG